MKLLQSLIVLVNLLTVSLCSEIAVYWGQNSGGTQGRLSDYCNSNSVDIVLLSFLYLYPDPLQLNFANACGGQYTDEGVLACPTIGEDIKICQSKGVKVLLSLGGATGAYGFTDDAQAITFAKTLWDLFGNGQSTAGRPFGDAVVDGFDFDIENNSQTGNLALATKLRDYFATDSTKQYYISAAPQCVYPDASVGDLLANGFLDYAFIQFYNNWCNLGPNFNWNVWADYAKNTSPNKDIKLFVGLPGAPASAGSGYVPPADVPNYVDDDILNNPNFGGISLWDASSGWGNVEDGVNYVQSMKQIVARDTPIESSSSISAYPTTTAESSSSSSSVATTTAVLPESESVSSVESSAIETSSEIESSSASEIVSSAESSSAIETSSEIESASETVSSAESLSAIESSSEIESVSASETASSAESSSAIASSAESSLVSESTSTTESSESASATLSSSNTPSDSSIAPTASESLSSEPTASSSSLTSDAPSSSPSITSLSVSPSSSDAPKSTEYTYKIITVIDGVTVVRTHTTTLILTQYVTVYN